MSTGIGLGRRFRRGVSLRLFAPVFVRLLVLVAVALGGQAARGATFEELAVVSDPGDEWYRAGDDINIRATFDEMVEVRHNPDLKLRINIGGTQRQAALTSRSPARQFTFSYRVQDGDSDSDGISVDANAFVGGSFVDPDDNTNVNVATATLATIAEHKVDAVAPSVAGAPSIVSDPGGDNTYAIGDVIEIEIDFNEAIRVQGNPQLVLSLGRNGAIPPTGPLSRRASLTRARPMQLAFRYQVQAGDGIDADGISIRADALMGGVIEDLRGNLARRELAATTFANHRVDAEEPSVVGVEITSAPARGNTYGAGEVIEAEITFNEVTYRRSGELRLRLDIGTAQPYANYATGSGTTKFTFRYTVQVQDRDDDGISIGPSALDGGIIEDAAGNNIVNRRIDPVREQPNHRVDGTTMNPTVTEVRFESSGGRNGYRIGDDVEVEVDFNVRVYVREPREPDEDAELRLILSIGEHSRYAAFVEGSGTETLLFRYTVQAGDYDDDGISIGPNALVGGILVDADGNNASRRFPAIRARRSQTVDALPPAIERAPRVSSSSGSDKWYGLGEPIDIQVVLNEPVHVTQTDDDMLALILAIGERTRRARFVAGSGTSQLEFRYTVRRDDYDDDGFTIGANALVGAVIEDNAGNNLGEADRRLLMPLLANRENRVDGGRGDDGVPFVKMVEFANKGDDAPYKLGDHIDIEVTFSEIVYARGQPTLALAIGGTERTAALHDGSGTRVLTFRYTVQAGDEGFGVGIGPGALQDGAIVDRAGNEARRDFEPKAADPRYSVDGVAPEVEGPLELTSKPTCGEDRKYYCLGDAIRVAIKYDENVYVTGALQLVISIGENSRRATFINGSGSRTLEFRYVVQRGDSDDNGISIGPDALVGGTIEDRAGNDWGETQRRLPPLEQQGDHRVNAAGGAARVEKLEVKPPKEAYYRAGEAIDIDVSFSETVHVSGSPTLELLIGSMSRQAALADGSGTPKLTFRYTVQAGDYDDDGISIGPGPSALSGGTIQDGAGFAVDRSFEAVPADGKRVDAVRPQLQSVAITSTPAANNTYRAGEDIEVTVEYDDDVRIVSDGNLTLELMVGAHPRPAVSTQSADTATRRLVFHYTVLAGDFDADGISIAADALSKGGGRLEDRVGKEVDQTLDPLPDQSGHLVGAEIALTGQLNLTVGGPPGVFNLYEDILVPQGIRHYIGTYRDPVSENAAVVTARVSGHRLVVTPHAEGVTNVLVTARDAAITLRFAVTVEANTAEVAVLQHALAAMGRGILASAANTIGMRLESKRHQPLLQYGRRSRVLASPATGRMPLGGAAAAGHASVSVGCTAATHIPCQQLGLPVRWPESSVASTAASLGGAPTPWQDTGSRMPRDASFEMPLIGGLARDTSWALWGAGDFSTFSGEPESANYEGDLSAAYLGVDARGEGWLAGVAVGRINAEADYDFTVREGTSERTSKGNLETTLTVVNPYVQWSLGERGRMWAMAGVGSGEASLKRENRASPAEPTDLALRMGMVGLRTEVAKAGNFRFAVRGDIGSVQLETDEGETAVHDLTVNVQRARVGVEASFPMVSRAGAEFTPFADIGARYDGGDGQTGGGVEVAAGVRASSSAVRFEAKARTLVMHGVDGYSETGASASVVVEPGADGNGLRLSLAPRWGGADDAMDVFWRKDADSGLQAFKREMERGWGVAGRIDYGVAREGRRGGKATVRPFGEVDLADDDNRRVRVGMAYQLESPTAGPLKFELSSERVERPTGTEHRFLLSAEGRF